MHHNFMFPQWSEPHESVSGLSHAAESLSKANTPISFTFTPKSSVLLGEGLGTDVYWNDAVALLSPKASVKVQHRNNGHASVCLSHTNDGHSQ